MTTPTTVSVRLQLRADTAANWTSANPTLLANELGRETDTGKIKIGDGSTAWSSLAYQAWATLPIAVASGGTGQTSYTNGQLLIGNTTGNTLTKATLTAGSGIAITNGTGSITVAASGISDAQIAADAEIAVSKLADGAARQLLQTDAAGTGVEWASNIDIPGTLDVTSAATFDSTIGASAGTASLPSITFTGDLNTGIYSPGADQVAISTGGSGRLFVDASGNVKLGASAASSFRLAVDGDTWFGNQTGTEIGRIFNDAGVLCLRASSNVTGLGLATNSSSSHAIRITSAGLVGVGTGSPGALFDATQNANAVSQQIRLTNTNTVGTVGSAIKFQGFYDTALISSDGVPGVSTGGSLRLQTYSSNGVLNTGINVDRLGNVGVGTTAASAVLHVVQTATDSAVRIQGRSSDDLARIDFYKNDNTTLNGRLQTIESSNNLRLRAEGALELYAGGNNQRAQIDSSGRLLVGTSSSATDTFHGVVQIEGLEAGNGVSSRLQLRRNTTTAGSGPGLVFDRSRGTTLGSYTAVQSGDLLGTIAFRGANGSTVNDGAFIEAYVDNTVSGGGVGDMPSRLVFSTTPDSGSSPVERMRLSNDGVLRRFGSGSAATNVFATNAAAGTTVQVITARYSATDVSSGTDSFYVYSNGNVLNTNNSYAGISDLKLKENIVDANSQWSDIKSLQIRKYNFKEGQTHTQIGLIAQEVELVSPGLVSESPDRDEEGNDLGTVTKSVNYSVLYMKAVKALQEAMERIEQLEAAVATLQGQ